MSKRYTLQDLEESYNLKLEKVISNIKKIKKKNPIVLIQFPDGLKPYATAVVDFLRRETKNKVEILIWLGSCYGACDTPVLGKELEKKIDLVIQFGHNDMMPKKL